MSGRQTNGSGPAIGTASHGVVRDLEASIATRLATAEQVRDTVAQAQTRAQAIVAKADARADETSRLRSTAILDAARSEAARLVADGERAATALTDASARRRADDVSAVLARVLPPTGMS
ncbi:MAG: hypothetical protein GEU96_10365 [Propionibacteriales bacterium]|nr:hypothetical protein [Propionibacteriales bacterium]